MIGRHAAETEEFAATPHRGVRGGLLEAVGVTKRFGGLVAVDDVSLTVQPGTVTALIGPNGAGKTTLFNCLTGLLRPDGGQLMLDGRDLAPLASHERARAGIGRTFQRLEAFTGMTVQENLQVACEMRDPTGVWSGMVGLARGSGRVGEEVAAMLDWLGLWGVRSTPAGDLPTGTLRLIELGRALCTAPRVLLLDEVASGQDSGETERLREILLELAEEGLAILLVEHDVEFVMGVCDTIYVMDFGRLIATGTPGEIRTSPEVRAAYLGVEDASAAGA